MGNIFGSTSNGRSNDYTELQSNARTQIFVKECTCAQVPEAKCLHWAIKERNLEYVS